MAFRQRSSLLFGYNALLQRVQKVSFLTEGGGTLRLTRSECSTQLRSLLGPERSLDCGAIVGPMEGSQGARNLGPLDRQLDLRLGGVVGRESCSVDGLIHR